jgi:hypothetical protein
MDLEHSIVGAPLQDVDSYQNLIVENETKISDRPWCVNKYIFKKKLEEVSCEFPKNVKVFKTWENLESEICSILEKKITDFFGEDLINDFHEIKKQSEKEAQEAKLSAEEIKKQFEEKITSLINERDSFERKLFLIKEGDDSKDENASIEAKRDEDVELRLLKKYDLDLSELEKQNSLFEKAVIGQAKEIKEYFDEIDKDLSGFDNIYGWVKSVPNLLKTNVDATMIKDILVSQIDEYVKDLDIRDRLATYKELKVDFFSLISRCDRYFYKGSNCNICITDVVTHCMNPCGHCFCLNCSNKINASKCHICRQSVKSKIKLHLL